MTTRKEDIVIIAGARPNFMKIAPIIRAMEKSPLLRPRLVHTGQHYDDSMSGSFFRELGIPAPEFDLKVGSGTHAQQTAEIMKRIEPVLDEISPRAILVVGDVNSTVACALVAVKKSIAVLHVEAGLRSFDRAMPEEINRVLTDQISDFLFTTEREANDNLMREGLGAEKIYFVGNVMVDSLDYSLDHAISANQTIVDLKLPQNIQDNYTLLTLHRPSNVDDEVIFTCLIKTISKISQTTPVLFPAHPRTISSIKRFKLESYFEGSNFYLLQSLSYLSMLGLLKNAKFVMTDSGGLQEETTALGVPCYTLRDNTERWITVTQGTNTMVGTRSEKLLNAYDDYCQGNLKCGVRPELWDGKAAERIVKVLEDSLVESK